MYEENNNKNPKRAGRKPGKKIGPIKPPTVVFARRVTPEEKRKLEDFLNTIRTPKDI